MPPQRRVFFNFHYMRDSWRAAQVRNIGVIEGNQPATDNDWETVKQGGNAAIERWISQQMRGRSCTVVLVGTGTAGRRWINYEIIKSWNDHMGVVGINIHGLQGPKKNIFPNAGPNPFDLISLNGSRLSSVVRCYNPEGSKSRRRYQWIENNIAEVVEEAIAIRSENHCNATLL